MYRKQISYWLLSCVLLVILMVIIGGLTRLTGSGLSITTWKPVLGIVPPFNIEGWNIEFYAYKQSPQFKVLNSNMTLEEFKDIFWLEFIHRLLGRLVGVVFFIPLFWFVWKKQISKRFFYILTFIFFLGGLQGLVGWYMVKSGLSDAIYVNQVWLAFHLLFATLIMAAIICCFCYSYGLNRNVLSHNKKLKLLVRGLLIIILVQLGLGALVAGLHAGMIYNSFPLMNGKFIPEDILFLQPKYLNFFNNPTTVQFQHRIGAYLVFFLATITFILTLISRNANSKQFILLVYVMFAAVMMQFGLGVLVLLLQVPIVLASIHQVLAIIIFAISIVINYIA